MDKVKKKGSRRDYTQELVTKEQWSEASDNCIEGAREVAEMSGLADSIYYFLYTEAMHIFYTNILEKQGFNKSIMKAMDFLHNIDNTLNPIE